MSRSIEVLALICGQDLQIHRVERGKVQISRLIDAEFEFWHCVEFDQALPARGEEVMP